MCIFDTVSFLEKIKFGEVVMAPPTFTAKPRKAPETVKVLLYFIIIYFIG